MSQPSPNKRTRTILIILLLPLLALILLLLGRCKKSAAPTPDAPAPAPQSAAAPSSPNAPPTEPAEILTPATIQLRTHTVAGSAFTVIWTGPDNPGDYLTIARTDAPATAYETYAETKLGRTLELTAPIEPGAYEVRYVALRSKKILGRTPLHVAPASATLNAVPAAPLDTAVSVTWTGPNNKDDFLTIVPAGTPDSGYGHYSETKQGSPATIKTPGKAGDAEIRYVTGQGRKVLARRPLKITTPETSISAPAEAIAGAPVSVTWIGPDNRGDYLTIVPTGAAANVYQNYTDASKGSPLSITAPIEPGAFEIRYVAAQGKNVLARRPIKIVAAEIEIDAPAQATAGSPVSIRWAGPNNRGDYLTIVVAGTPDGQYAAYADTTRGTPLSIKAPAKPGPAEIRYMSGQGAKVLARRPIEIIP
jgi:hypothetical protein